MNRKEDLMPQPPISPETVMKLTDTKQQLSQVINCVARGETRVVVEKSGLAVAVIISPADYRQFKEQAETTARRELFDAFTKISAAFADVPDEELERETAKAIAQARAEGRAERAAATTA